MRHRRHWTVAEANAALPWVRPRLERVRAARRRLARLGAEKTLARLSPAVGGAYPGRPTAAAALELQFALAELEALELVVRDLDRGLLDFPSLRGEDEVYLCWQLDEDEVRFWHWPDAGFAGRRPL